MKQKIRFEHHLIPDTHFEAIHSLAKWKRHLISKYKFAPYSGIYVEGNYIRSHEPVLDELHSMYIMQFDWEVVITKADRSLDFLKKTVRDIYSGLVEVESFMLELYPH